MKVIAFKVWESEDGLSSTHYNSAYTEKEWESISEEEKEIAKSVAAELYGTDPELLVVEAINV